MGLWKLCHAASCLSAVDVNQTCHGPQLVLFTFPRGLFGIQLILYIPQSIHLTFRHEMPLVGESAKARCGCWKSCCSRNRAVAAGHISSVAKSVSFRQDLTHISSSEVCAGLCVRARHRL